MPGDGERVARVEPATGEVDLARLAIALYRTEHGSEGVTEYGALLSVGELDEYLMEGPGPPWSMTPRWSRARQRASPDRGPAIGETAVRSMAQSRSARTLTPLQGDASRTIGHFRAATRPA